jgi:hypothetical protein
MASLQAGHACTVRGATSITKTSKQPAIKFVHFMQHLHRIVLADLSQMNAFGNSESTSMV